MITICVDLNRSSLREARDQIEAADLVHLEIGDDEVVVHTVHIQPNFRRYGSRSTATRGVVAMCAEIVDLAVLDDMIDPAVRRGLRSEGLAVSRRVT